MESGAELDEGGDAALRDDAPRVGLVDAGDDPDQRALAGAVPAQDAQRGAGRDGETDARERLHVRSHLADVHEQRGEQGEYYVRSHG